MLPGYRGHLVSECFLESQLDQESDSHAAARFRRTLSAQRRRCRTLGPASSVRSLFETAGAPLVDALGFEAAANREVRDRGLLFATIGRTPLRVGLVVAPWGSRLDPLWRPAVTDALNRSAAWSFIFNGTHLRIVDAGRLHSRRYAEFELDVAADEARACAALWWIARAERFAEDAASGVASLRAIVAESERHASGVCRSLREGVLAASTDVLQALVARRTRADLPDSFEQSLTIVYRLLFLLFAEARGLVPLWHPLYRASYSIDALRGSAERPRGALGLWDTLRAISRLAHAGCRAGDLRVTPFNGRLFAPSRTPLVERLDLDDEAARRAVLALTTRPAPDRQGRERIAYRDLGVEQLGAVYETLLDYEPHVRRPGGRDAATAVVLTRGSGVRKATGSFYTPQSIADYLVRRALGPLVRDAPPEQILKLRIVDPAMGSGAFLVAALRYLGATYEQALVRGGGYHESDFGERERVSIRRTLAERCLYGVDLNPMAVQLARLSMWLATLAADRPLTFLDHRLVVGDSLSGAWLSTIRQAPLPRPGRRGPEAGGLPLFEGEDVRRALTAALPVRFQLEETADETLEQVRAKERALTALNRRDHALSAWKRIADLWCASWFAADGDVPPSAFGALSDRILTGRGALPDRTADAYLERAEAIAASRRFFHWELEFPEVFMEHDGSRSPAAGFDAVIGNPPWDMIRADAGAADVRSRSRDDVGRLLRFTRDSGLYVAQSDGHANRYQLFLERAMALARPGGRLGLVLPSGLATDHGSARLRSRLLSACRVDALVGFDNHRGVFPIHRSVRFLLITATAGSPTERIACRFGEQSPAALESIGDDDASATTAFPVSLTPSLLHRLSGDGLAIPDIRTTLDLAIVERAAALFPPCGEADGWSAQFGRELNATDDREHFRSGGSGVPIVEGKQIEPFRVHVDRALRTIADREVCRLLGSPRHERPRLGYRDVASATNRFTMIAAILPRGCVSTHTVFCLRPALPLQSQYFLCGLLNSFVVNYLVRQRVTSHVTTATVERLPLPRQHDSPRVYRQIAALARILTRRDDEHAAAQLQALVAGLYQLTTAEFEHVLETFPLVPREAREAALRAFSHGDTETRR